MTLTSSIEPQQLRWFQQWSLPHSFVPSGANYCKDRCQCGEVKSHEIHQPVQKEVI